MRLGKRKTSEEEIGRFLFIESAIASGRNVLNVTCERRRRGLNYFSYSIVVVFLWENDVVFFFFFDAQGRFAPKKKKQQEESEKISRRKRGENIRRERSDLSRRLKTRPESAVTDFLREAYSAETSPIS